MRALTALVLCALQEPPLLENKVIQARRVESQTPKCIVQGLGRIQIGLPMSTGGMCMGLDVDALN